MAVEEAMEETHGCGNQNSPAADSASSCGNRGGGVGNETKQQRQHRYKLEIYNEVLRRLREANVPSASNPDFEDDLWAHFNRLPARYAIDVNAERAEDVLMHKQLLEEARDPTRRPAFSVRLVQVSPTPEVNHTYSTDNGGGNAVSSKPLGRQSIHPPPAFGSSANLEALALEASKSHDQNIDNVPDDSPQIDRPMHEITFSTYDKPKLLSELTSLLSELGLNIQEAHAFSTNDGYSLDVFVVAGWDFEETEHLTEALKEEIQRIEMKSMSNASGTPVNNEQSISTELRTDHVEIPNDGTDVWEIDNKMLKFGNKVASGSFGDLFRGLYCNQDVAIKVLKPERINTDVQQEFAQEVFIMRKVRHKNIVQFIGACTRPPNLFIVTEFMAGGSVYDYLHKHKGVFKLSILLRVAIDVSKGMNYLHQNNIIHRDLKTANLLMDENEVVKVADFGVARVKCQSGVMTAETGTYRWMAPEVIEHKPYDHKADVFSFGILLWELLTGKIPYEYLTPLQAAVGVVQKNLRPTIPKGTHSKLTELLEKCWQQDPTRRPDFIEILASLQIIAKEVQREHEDHHKEKSGRFLSALRRGH